MSINFKLSITASPDKIYKAITTKQGYQGWWAVVCDVDCQLHQISSIRFEKESVIEEMLFETIEVKENKKLVWRCVSNNVFESWIGTTLSFEIDDARKNSELLFTQSSLDKKWKDHADYGASLAGWKYFMGSLKKYCEMGKGEPWGNDKTLKR